MAVVPEQWAAEEPGRGPYVLRAVAEECNHPLAAEQVNEIGPRLDEANRIRRSSRSSALSVARAGSLQWPGACTILNSKRAG
jgi:hypothetical protein